MSRKTTELVAVDWQFERNAPSSARRRAVTAAPRATASQPHRRTFLCDCVGVALGFAIALLFLDPLRPIRGNEIVARSLDTSPCSRSHSRRAGSTRATIGAA